MSIKMEKVKTLLGKMLLDLVIRVRVVAVLIWNRLRLLLIVLISKRSTGAVGIFFNIRGVRQGNVVINRYSLQISGKSSLLFTADSY